MKKREQAETVAALKIQQWMSGWSRFEFDANARQAQPIPYFYLFSLQASHLKRLTGVYRRSTKGQKPRSKDPNVQRGHEEARSSEIREFVRFGFPWCEMGESKRKAPGADGLRKPGWLPTAILVNILEEGAVRNGKTIAKNDLITVQEENGLVTLDLPRGFDGDKWEPSEIYPLEVIDGQHRLWAFEGFDPGPAFELPVVAFHGLDRGWQAYLFWSVNITPKRINKSLAYDLYPLLRRDDWLDRFAGHAIYRETRSQELVEALWGHIESPWYQRINMLGETAAQRESKTPMVTQAAWVRSLLATFVKEWIESGKRLGGLFGAPRAFDKSYLPWNRAMQAAFLINAGASLQDELKKSRADWAEFLRKTKEAHLFQSEHEDDDQAFFGKYSLLTTDQGIRGFLLVINDLCLAHSDKLKLNEWGWDDVERKAPSDAAATDDRAVSAALASLRQQPVAYFVSQISRALVKFDWRTSATPGLDPTSHDKQSIYRGSSGYRALRLNLLGHLSSDDMPAAVRESAKQVTASIK